MEMTKMAVTSFPGNLITLAASAARVADGTGTAVLIDGKKVAYIVVCEWTDKKTDATDLMDVFVDVLVGTKWINAIHFTQAKGDGTDAATEYAVLCPSGANTAPTVATADLASGAVRGDAFGSQMRARWDFTDGGGGGAATFTFSVTAYAI
jgi:hypothetical protein